ncbi:MAG: DUF2520 domain-containing protein [Bacteroidetes bacterium]|nr:DUF2520 domain-containing protein [Bacteroidota bacterium]
MPRPVSIAVIGKGKLGRSLSAAIQSCHGRYTLFANVPARTASFARLGKNGGPDVVFVVCADRFVRDTAARAIAACGVNTTIAIHCAGSLPASVLPSHLGVARAMLHPIQTFAKPSARAFNGITFGLQSTDKKARDFALPFSKAIGGKDVIELVERQLPLYHTSTVFAANFVTLLVAAVESISLDLDQAPKRFKAALAPLMQTALANALHKPAFAALTGPIARGDTETIASHRAALRKIGRRDLLTIYDAFVGLARELS